MAAISQEITAIKFSLEEIYQGIITASPVPLIGNRSFLERTTPAPIPIMAATTTTAGNGPCQEKKSGACVVTFAVVTVVVVVPGTSAVTVEVPG